MELEIYVITNYVTLSPFLLSLTEHSSQTQQIKSILSIVHRIGSLSAIQLCR